MNYTAIAITAIICVTLCFISAMSNLKDKNDESEDE